MQDKSIQSIQQDYDSVADEYARHIDSELDNKPLDRELLTRFASAVKGKGQVCDMGCGPGHVARFLHNACPDANLDVFGLDLSPRMLEEARRRNPEIPFRQGNILALDLPDNSLAGIVAFYAIVNLPRTAVPKAFREMARLLRSGARCCSPITSGKKRFIEMTGGIALSTWTSISINRKASSAISRPPVWSSRRSSSANRTRLKWSTRAAEPISSPASRLPDIEPVYGIRSAPRMAR